MRPIGPRVIVHLTGDYGAALASAAEQIGSEVTRFMMRLPIGRVPPSDMQWKAAAGTLARLTICIVAVATITAVLYAVPPRDRALSASLTFLLVVLIVSAVWGFRYAVFLSLLAALGFSWLLPPVGVFWIDDPREVVRLAAFFFIGLLASGLLDRAREEARKVKQREDALRRSEAYLAEGQRLTHTGSWAWNPVSGKAHYWSEGMFRIFGLDPQKGIPGRATFWQRCVHPEDRDKVYAHIRKAAGEKVDYSIEHRTVLPDGSVRYHQAIGHPVLSSAGEVVEYIGTAVDVTDRRGAERELRESETRFRTYVDHATDAFYVLERGEKSQIIDVNRQGCESHGYTREELIGMSPLDFDAGADEAFLKRLGAQIDAGDTFETSLQRKDGSVFPVEVRVRPFSHEGRRLVLSLARDITERKRAEEALRESEEQWKAVFENNPTMYFMVDAAGTILSVNPFGAEQLGYTVDELIGSAVQNIFHDADREAALKNAATCLEELGRPMIWELRKIRKNGEVMWVRETARATMIKSLPVILIACEDITEGKRAAEALREVQTELAHANRVATMGQLTASIAHEVKQPVGATLINAQSALRFLDREPVDLDEIRQTFGDIIKDSVRASEIFDRIRDLTKKARPRRDRFEINAAIREVIELTHGEAVKNGVCVATQLADGLPLIEGDRVQLQQVILNLVVNAIQAMAGVPVGSRELCIRSESTDPEGVRVSVQDSGPGLSPDSVERLFEPFYTTKSEGMGLGLSICHSIIEAHGGQLIASTNVPTGALFQFTVPTRPVV
jgi:PAS domain S-box-containing protein